MNIFIFFFLKKGGLSGLKSSSGLLIGVGGAAVVLIGGIVFVVSRSKRTANDDYSKRFSSNDTDMKKISEPYIGLNNSDNKDNFSIGQPFNTSISNPVSNYSSNWNSPTDSPLLSGNKSFNGSSNNLLAAPEEPKRVNSITFEEQENFSNMLKKHLDEDRSPKIATSPSFSKPNIPDEYEKFKTFKVVRKFTPQRNDELVVEIGNMVKMIKSFEDGWTLCYNISTRKEGYIPKNKLASLDQPSKPQTIFHSDTTGSNSSYASKPQKPQTIFHSDTTSTTSSAYSTKPLLHSDSAASSNYSNNNSYGRNRNQRPVNTRNNSNASARNSK